ncbi:deSI-like protein At4g17486 isoform X4 [Phoenix dactylifera]|uniref:DeSI-like protein At4g17486 isoform X4 n=1 Tax=Phoenix dactylifera TaxID=42345 RepID=A0A8B9A1R0_PHODC|nr:deSI-like protein At4g17486 isoform X4 [Phoenix dactylifera]
MKFGSKKGWKTLMPLRLHRKSATRFCMFPKVRSASQTPGNAPVYLNVYDLTPMNGYVYWAGLGIYHTGVEVHGVEYAFGAHDYPTSGVFEVEPRQCPGFRFRKSIFMGTTCLDPMQDICYKLTGNRIPKWVNRLARIGALCNCLLPETLKISAVHHDPDSQAEDGEKRRLRSAFSCLSSISMRQRQLSASSLFLPSPLKGCLPPWELKRSGAILLKERKAFDQFLSSGMK